MTEDEAKAWLAARYDRSALDKLGRFVDMVIAENKVQNLVSTASLASIWSRHVVDSAQMLDSFGDIDGSWVDIGTGGGFPGMVIAILREHKTVLVEPRRGRAAFLAMAAQDLGLGNVEVRQTKVAQVTNVQAAIISARAVASIGKLFHDTDAIRSRDTVYIFPRGRSAADEVSAVKQDWRGVFHVKQSITDPNSAILIARQVTAR